MSSARRTGLTLYAVAGLILIAAFGGGWILAPSVTTSSAELTNKSNIVGIHGAGTIQLTDGNGVVEWSHGNAESYFDVDVGGNNTVLTTFLRSSERCGQFEAPCARTGIQIISPDPEPHVVYEWTYPVRDGLNSEVHDADRLPSGNIIIAGMEYERVFILNPETESIIWTWNASSQYNEPIDPTQTDWLHINDVDRIGEERYLVSVRNANQLLVIERDHGVVEIINKDRDPNVINHQHNPQWLRNDTVLVADSENDRVVEIQKNNQSWEVIWSINSAGGIPFDWPRDADRLPNGNTLITDSSNNRIVEINKQGVALTSYETPRWPYEADRLPGDEMVGGPVHGSSGSTFSVTTEDIPVLTPLLVTAQSLIAVPFWVSEIHVLVVLIALTLVVVGTERLLSQQITVLIGQIDKRLSLIYDASGIIIVQTPPLLIGIGVWLLLSGAVSSDFTGFKLATGAILLVLGWDIVLSGNPTTSVNQKISTRTQTLVKLLIAAIAIPISGAVFYTGLAFPGPPVLDAGLSIALIVSVLRLLRPRRTVDDG